MAFIFCVLVYTTAFSQELKVGDKLLSDIKVQEINNGTLTDASFAQLTKEKIVIVEFWETSCGPCIDGLFHLKNIQEKFKNDLVVIGVSKLEYDKTVSFIKENQFPFHFLFEKQNELSMLFPHNKIPHSIVIDKKGIIQNITHPSFITEEVISDLLNNKINSLPQKSSSISEQNEDNLNGLLVFNFKRSSLDDISYIQSEPVIKSVQFVYGYSSDSYRDTIEVVMKFKICRMNALGLYQIAYNNLSINRFIYPQSIKWINSYTPNNLFNLEYSISNLMPGSTFKLQKQLDLLFDLHSTLIECDTTVLVLKQIMPNDSTIKIVQKRSSDKVDTYTEKTTSKYSYRSVNVDSEYGNEQDLARVLEGKFGIPVLCNNAYQDIKYQFKLNIINENKDLDVWLNCLKDYGIVLEKKKSKIAYVKIED
jgi:AhpC/TSA family.